MPPSPNKTSTGKVSTDNAGRPATTSRNPSPGEFPYASAIPTAAPITAQLRADAHGRPLAPEMMHQTGDGTGGLIPYKNPKALSSYYLGIVSLLPVIGFPFGIASIVLGIGGLRARSRNPIIKGSVHAIIGIGLGVCGMPLHLLFGAAVVVALGSAAFGA